MTDKPDTGYDPTNKPTTGYGGTAKSDTSYTKLPPNPNYNPTIYDSHITYDDHLEYNGGGIGQPQYIQDPTTGYANVTKPQTGYARP